MWLWTLIAFASSAVVLACVALTFLELVFIHSVATAGTAKTCFVVAFTLSGSIFVTLLYGLLGLIAPATAEVLLSLLLTAQVLTVAAGLPFVTFRAFAKQFVGGVLATAIPIVLIIAGWAAITSMTDPCSAVDDSAVVPDAGANPPCTGWTDAITARVALLGVFLVGTLGGFAIVSTPASYLEPVLRWRAVSLAERRVGDLLSRQLHVSRMWCAKRTALALVVSSKKHSTVHGAGGAAPAAGGFFSRLRSAFEAGDASEHSLTVECEGYSHVSTGLFLAAQEAVELHTTAAKSRSWQGVVFTGYGAKRSCYCGVQHVMTMAHLLHGRVSPLDPDPRAFTILGLVTGDSMGFLSTQLANVSLLFNAAMVVSAIRGFLILVFRLTCNNRAVTAETSLFAFSLVLSLYFLGLAVMMRLALPNDLRALLAQAIGALPYRYYHWWHDVVQLCAAVATLAVRRFMFDDASAND
jgi:hypothetical protein